MWARHSENQSLYRLLVSYAPAKRRYLVDALTVKRLHTLLREPGRRVQRDRLPCGIMYPHPRLQCLPAILQRRMATCRPFMRVSQTRISRRRKRWRKPPATGVCAPGSGAVVSAPTSTHLHVPTVTQILLHEKSVRLWYLSEGFRWGWVPARGVTSFRSRRTQMCHHRPTRCRAL